MELIKKPSIHVETSPDLKWQLTKNVSEQWPHVTRHMPGNDETGGVTGLGAKFIIRLQFGRGQAIRCDELLQINRQLHGHRTYFLPGGAFRIGWKIENKFEEIESAIACCVM